MSLLYCSLTGTDSNWYDRLSQVYKMTGLPSFKFSKKQVYHAQFGERSFVERDNKNEQSYVFKVEPMLKKAGKMSAHLL